MHLVSNASPVIFLAKIGLVHVLPRMTETLIIPGGVYHEILKGQDEASEWIKNHKTDYVVNVSSIPPVIQSWDLGKGEAEVIAYAHKNRGFRVVLDDKAARNCASGMQINIIGTIGIILMAKRNGVIPDAVVYLKKLKETGYRINDQLYKQAIELAK